jgi:hypothetical protein
MNKYPLSIGITEKPNTLGLAVAVIENNRIVELQHMEDILGAEYHVITHGVYEFTEEILDKLCFHEKTKEVCFNLSWSGDVCFGMISDNMFYEL